MTFSGWVMPALLTNVVLGPSRCSTAATAATQDPNAHKFTLRNCLKDITYYNRLATRNNAATLMSDGALQAMKLSLNLGYGDRFMPELVDVFAALSDLEPSPDTKA